MANAISSYQPFYTPEVNKQLMQAQQQQALAQALLSEGISPVSTKDRMMGNIAYKISPWEGVNKLADALAGVSGLRQANQSYAGAFSPPSDDQTPAAPTDNSPSLLERIGNALSPSPPDQSIPNGQSASVPDVQGPQQLPPIQGAGLEPDPLDQYRQYNGMQAPPIDAQRASMGMPVGSQIMQPQQMASVAAPVAQPQPQQPQWSPYSPMGQQVMSGDPKALTQYGALLTTNPDTARAGAELLTNAMRPTLAGPTAYNTKLGENAAALAPPGALPPGIASPAGVAPALPQGQRIPPLNVSALAAPVPLGGGNPMPPPPQGVASAAPSAIAPAPSPSDYPTTAAYQAAMKIYEAGQSKQAEQQGEGLGKAVVGAATIDSRYDNAQSLISAAALAAKNSSYGVMTDTKEAYHNQMNDKTATANADYKNRMSQLLTQALPAVVQASGGRIDIPLLNAIKDAENADISLSPDAKMKVLQNLSQALDQQRQNAHNQVGNLSGQASTVPSNYFTPQQIQAEIQRRNLAGK